jgi:hypothetical protein
VTNHVSRRYIVLHFIIWFLDKWGNDDDHDDGVGCDDDDDNDDDENGEERSQYKHMHNEEPRKSKSQMGLTPTLWEKLSTMG